MEVSGEGNGVGGWGGHAWNKIKLDGEWYHVDVTWEDPIMNGDPENGYGYGNLRNEYINITDSKWRKITDGLRRNRHARRQSMEDQQFPNI